MKRLFLAIMFGIAAVTGAVAGDLKGHSGLVENFVELEKTANYFAVQVQFADCDKPSSWVVQDGAMNALKIEGKPIVRFIVKRDKNNIVNFHAVNEAEFDNDGAKVKGLRIQKGISVGTEISFDAMAAAGIKSFKMSEYIMKDARNTAQPPKNCPSCQIGTNSFSSHEPSSEDGAHMKCCSFQACNGLKGVFCTTGLPCGDAAGGNVAKQDLTHFVS